MVYATKPETLEELRDKLEYVINHITLEIIQTLHYSVRSRRSKCTVGAGGHFDHVRT